MPDPDPVSIFFLYAPEDEALRSALEKHLVMLKREGLVSGWSDRMVSPGAEWRSEIERRLNDARIILALISADLLASDAYDEEMQRALKRHQQGKATLLMVLARPVDWTLGPFHDLQPVNDTPLTSHEDGLDAALAEVAAKIRRLVRATSANPRVAHRPYAPSR
jgi:TIR domain-containing protein